MRGQVQFLGHQGNLSKTAEKTSGRKAYMSDGQKYRSGRHTCCVFIHLKWHFAPCLQPMLTNDPRHTVVVKQKWWDVVFGADSTAIESSWSDLELCIFPLSKEDFLGCLGVSVSVFSFRMSNSVLYMVSDAGGNGMHLVSSSGQWTLWRVHQSDSCCAGWTLLQLTEHYFKLRSRYDAKVWRHNHTITGTCE